MIRRRALGPRARDIGLGLLAVLLAFCAVPTTLLVVGGDPFSFRLGLAVAVLQHDAFDACVLVAWTAWCFCTGQLLVVIGRHLSGAAPHAGPTAGIADALAARIAAGVLALYPVALSHVPVGRIPAAAAVHGAGAPARWQQSGAVGYAGSVTLYRTRAGESLPEIAANVYGDAGTWVDVARPNLGRLMPGGRRFVDPSVVGGGWNLVIPGPRPARPADATNGELAPRRPPGAGVLPELAALGVSAPLAALIAARLVRQRARRARLDLRRADVSDEQADLEIRVAPFAGLPAVGQLETALRILWETMATLPLAAHPDISYIRNSPDGVDLHLRTAADPAPPWAGRGGGTVWRISGTQLAAREVRRGSPCACPVLLPMGTAGDSSLYVPLERGSSLSVVGPDAARLVAAMTLTLELWPWSDQVRLTSDPHEADSGVGAAGPARGAPPPQILFHGDPSRLSADGRSRCAVLTTQAVPDAEVVVVVDHRGATVHPLGLMTTPDLASPRIAELVRAMADTTPTPVRALPASGPGSHPRLTGVVRRGGGHGDPGVRVRLLTPLPRIDGLAAALDPRRARRAVEFVAYLAIHRPDAVTSDRLRTRVLGSSDADAAAKTLFNTAGAARRALGDTTRGAPLLPPATKSGHYRVADEVDLDVRLLIDQVESVSDGQSVDDQLEALRSALSWIEGEPMANALSGYSWWTAEGHAARLADTVVAGACRFVELACGQRLTGDAAWAVHQARLVEPYSEALTRAAMCIASEEGDLDHLRREWTDCRRRSEELEPGGAPSYRTEQLYVSLVRRVRGGPGAADTPEMATAGPGRR